MESSKDLQTAFNHLQLWGISFLACIGTVSAQIMKWNSIPGYFRGKTKERLCKVWRKALMTGDAGTDGADRDKRTLELYPRENQELQRIAKLARYAAETEAP